MAKPRILFITGMSKPHPFHKSLAEAVGADTFTSKILGDKKFQKSPANLVKSVLLLPKNYDIYLSETVFIIPSIAKILHLIPKTSKIVNICADPILYNLVHKIPNGLPAPVFRHLLSQVDGFIIIGPWRSLLRNLNIKVPRIVIKGGVEDKIYEELIRINRTKFNHNIIFVGNVTQSRIRYKGIDILLKAFEIVKKKYSDSRLYITGNSHFEAPYEGVIFTGYESKLFDVLKKASLAASLGRGDTYPTGAIEAMLSGLPTLVSKDVGAREIAGKVDKNFVTNLNPREVADKMIKYFELSNSKKARLSKEFKEAAKFYKTSMILEDYKKKWAKFTRDLGKN
jgi:glycosyltransferase involved in cell wall biosynthesis